MKHDSDALSESLPHLSGAQDSLEREGSDSANPARMLSESLRSSLAGESAEPAIDGDAWTGEATWVRGLALRLVRDPHEAEDLAQEAVLAALQLGESSQESPERQPRSRKAWLAGVLRNRLRDSLRTSDRRKRREEWAARDDSIPSVAQDVERRDVEVELTTELMGLAEHYRETLLRRFYQDQKPQAIAREMSVPVSTVKTRLDRGLDQLRERLDRRHDGDRQAWLSGLLPLLSALPKEPALPLSTPLANAGVASGTASAPAAKLTMVGGLSVWQLALSLALLLTGSAFWWWPQSASDARDIAGLEQERTGPKEPAELSPGSTVGVDATSRTAVDAEVGEGFGTQTALSLEALQTPETLVAGRLVSSDGRALPGVLLEFVSDAGPGSTERSGNGSAVSLSDRTGHFELKRSSRRGTGVVRVGSSGWVTLLAGRPGQSTSFNGTEGSDEMLVVAERAVALSATVRDSEGHALSGVRCSLELPDSWLANWRGQTENLIPMDFTRQSNSQGVVEWELAPRMDGLRWTASRSGFEAAEGALADGGESGIEVTLVRLPAAEGLRLSGRLTEQDGAAVADAQVVLVTPNSVVRQETRTDEFGAFVFTVPVASASSDSLGGLQLTGASRLRLLAWKEQRVGQRVVTVEEWQTPGSDCDLQLSQTAQEVGGRVLDESGRAVAGATVWLRNPTLLAAPVRYVDQGGGGSELGNVGEPWSQGRFLITENATGEKRAPRGPGSLECELQERWGETWVRSRTDSDGRFEMVGILARPYELEACNPVCDQRGRAVWDPNEDAQDDRLVQTSERDSELVLHLKGVGLAEEFTDKQLRLQDASGAPLSGIRVATITPAFGDRETNGGSQVSGGSSTSFERSFSVSDEQGEVWLSGLSKGVGALYFEGDFVLPRTVSTLDLLAQKPEVTGSAASANGKALTVVMQSTARLSVRLSSESEADAFDIVDSNAQVLSLLERRGLDQHLRKLVNLRASQSPVLWVPVEARKLRLLKGKQLLREVLLELKVGEQLDLRL